MMFVAYDIFECFSYTCRVCRSAKNNGRKSRDTVPLILIVSSTIFEHVFASAYCIWVCVYSYVYQCYYIFLEKEMETFVILSPGLGFLVYLINYIN